MAEYFFDQRIRNDIKTYEKTRKIDYTSDCLLDYPYFKEFMIS